MVTINWTDEAVGWLREIYAYIANDNPKAARNTVNNILEKAKLLGGCKLIRVTAYFQCRRIRRF